MIDKNTANKHASILFNAIKKNIADARKENKAKNLTGWARKRTTIDIIYTENGTFNKKTNSYDYTYGIRIEYTQVEVKGLGKYDVERVADALLAFLNQQKKVKGWTNLVIVTEKVNIESYGYHSYNITAPVKVSLPDAQCSEYKSLRNYINKYGKGRYGSSVNLGDYELFSSAMGGKRGVIWDEHGEREFLDTYPKRCRTYLAELRKYRGTKDTMECVKLTEKYIDEAEQRYSAYAEIECEGELRHYLLVTIKSPNGKVKYQDKLF